jgi:hydroxymethylpyrimidine pyrophosphatase-like HAD family hydrolase/orotate phosphoribosyltransferase
MTNYGRYPATVGHATRVLAEPPAVPRDGLAVADLLADPGEVTRRLSDSLTTGDALDAYLLAAGAVQIVEDHLQRDLLALRRAASYLRDRGFPAWVTLVLAVLATGCEWLRALRPSERRTERWRDESARLRDLLARRLVAAPDAVLPPGDEIAWARRLGDQVPALHPRLSSAVLRLPSCFRSFDQHPDDMVVLAARYARKHPARDRAVLVLGVRTSGSYLAPLVAAALLAEGFTDVRAETARPEHRLRTRVRKSSRWVTRQGGRVAIVDDPPTTGHALQQVARQLIRGGVAEQALTLLLSLFDEVPEPLRAYDSVVLPVGEWSAQRRFEPAAVGVALASLWGRPVRSVRRLPGDLGVPRRGHHRALFDVVLPDGEHRTVVAAGAGVGYFGRHALAVARALPEYLPRTHGFADGVVFRDWLPADHRLSTVCPEEAPRLAGYVRARAAALPAVSDHSARLAGRQPVWEAGSRVLQEGYGRLGVLLRPVLIDPVLRRLCSVPRPSVIDGATDVAHWFREQGALRKVNADVRAFANTDLACYDPAYDLAGIDPGGRDPEVVAALRGAMVCDDERFLIYQLVHLWDRQRAGAAAHRESARSVQRYVSEQFLAGLTPTDTGPLCAVDVDGVLESDALGFPIITPSAALALRSLIAHGYRPVLATGRSLDEVRERCESYGLVGGVAEYGAVIYDHSTGTVRELVSAADLHTLAEVRDVLRRTPGVSVDEDYRYIVRVRRSGTGGGRRSLPTELVRTMLAGIDTERRVRVINGHGQTDLLAAGVDKGDGLRSLADLLGTCADPRGIALAIGDSAADLPMFALARHAYAPANADAEVRAAGVHLLGRGYAAGLAQAVQRLTGHRPGTCPTCLPPVPTARTQALLTLLDAQHRGARGLPLTVVRGLRHRLRWTS